MGKGRIKLDIIGKKFGKLTVLYQVLRHGDKIYKKRNGNYILK